MNTPNTPAVEEKKPGIVRRLYDWMLSWANSPWASLAMFLFAMAESIFFPIPPDVLLIALCVGMPKKSFRYALLQLLSAFT